MSDLLAFIAEHGATTIAVVTSLRAIWRAKAMRDAAAAQAVKAVIGQLDESKQAHRVCTRQLKRLERRLAEAEKRMVAAEKISVALDKELKTLMSEIHASNGGS